MTLSLKHPSRATIDPDWELMRHSYAGERKIKDMRETYLPATSGMRADGLQQGDNGRAQYDAYLTRAVYHDLVRPAVEGLLGIMHNKPPVVELPAKLQAYLQSCTVEGENLQSLLRRINEQQLLMGRIGLLMDVPTGQTAATALPYFATYDAERILNWDVATPEYGPKKLAAVLLDETFQKRTTGFSFEEIKRRRILSLGSIVPSIDTGVVAADDNYYVKVTEGDTLSTGDWIKPSLSGKELSEIPFIFVGSKDLVPDPDYPPLLPLARLGLAIYRGEADYRQALFMQGQETLVVIGATTSDDDTTRLGAGAQIDLPMGGDAKYVGVSSNGLGEMRQALTNDKATAMEYGARLLDNRGKEAESGDALRVRVASRTATLSTVAETGGMAMLMMLRKAAEWVGEDPNKVVFVPNKDFSDVKLTPRDLLELQQAKQMGAPLSQKSVHKVARDKGYTDLSYEEEMTEIDGEEPLGPQPEDETGQSEPGSNTL